MSLITVIKLLQEDNNPTSTNVKNSTSGTWQISKPKAKSIAQGISVNEEPIKSARSSNVRNQVAAEIVTSNSFDLLPSQNDSVGVIEINDENTPSKRMSLI